MTQILVTGSTSNVGRPLVARLETLGERVRAAMREPSRGEGSEVIQPIWFDYAEPRSFGPALDDVDRVVVINPPTPTPDPLVTPFLEAATRDGRKVVLMTAMGTEDEDEGSLRQIERALEQSGAPFVILRPNWFMDNFHTAWAEGIKHTGAIALPAADARVSLVDARDIADAAVAALRSDRFDGRAFTLTGPEALTFREAAAALSQAANREIIYAAIDDEAFVTAMVEAGAPADLARYLAELFGVVRRGTTAAISPAIGELTGHTARTFEQYAKDHAAAWR